MLPARIYCIALQEDLVQEFAFKRAQILAAEKIKRDEKKARRVVGVRAPFTGPDVGKMLTFQSLLKSMRKEGVSDALYLDWQQCKKGKCSSRGGT